MEQHVITVNQANAPGLNLAAEIVGLVINHTPGGFLAEIYIHDGIESLLSVYGITGQLKFKRKILSSGSYEFSVDLKKGVYVATLISGKSWAARRIIVQ